MKIVSENRFSGKTYFLFNCLQNMKRLVMSAALLPSLNAEYSMENLTSKGMTGEKAKFVIDLPRHTLSFNTKLTGQEQREEGEEEMEANLPSEASIDLPKVQVSAEYIQASVD